MFDQNMSDGVSEEGRSPLCGSRVGGPCSEQVPPTTTTRAELECALRGHHGLKELPGSSKEGGGVGGQHPDMEESPAGGDSDYCRRILVRDAKGTIREIVLPKGLDLDRPKRTRTSFTAEQLYRLELEFQRCQYVVGRERTELARQLNLSETQTRSLYPFTRPSLEDMKRVLNYVSFETTDDPVRICNGHLIRPFQAERVGWRAI
ncbi:hypothetical protein NDU88_000865 [Pleurodeles waltl]|uniref:Homeobox domain-containing protein n=1 Tax=Pleurodeles waltl TaxID=8319 RepID=A0AAV7WKV5_PLEWA|nr:hypothetical protein NDU88_000865 [Pleurodeles waltl]